MIKRLRNNPSLNKLLRHCLRLLFQKDIWSKLMQKWRVFGTCTIIFEGIKIKLYSASDDGIVDALFYNPDEYSEKAELQLFTSWAKQSKTIIDIGANTGAYSLLAAKASPSAKIFAFEPYIINYNRLKKNVGLNNEVANIQLINKAVGNENGLLDITIPSTEVICDTVSGNQAFTSRFYNEWLQYKTSQVPQIRLDDFIPEHAIDRVDLMKIDVETLEMQVLLGAINTLQRDQPDIFCEVFVNEERSRFYKEHLLPLGYSVYIIAEKGLIKLQALEEHPDYTNYLFSTKKFPSNYISYKNL